MCSNCTLIYDFNGINDPTRCCSGISFMKLCHESEDLAVLFLILSLVGDCSLKVVGGSCREFEA